VPWGDSLAVSRTLALWQTAIGGAVPLKDGPLKEGPPQEGGQQQDMPEQEES
jgi:hypothetical protein